MEFWGVEVKPGHCLEVDIEEDYVIHLSQAAVGEFKGEKNEFIPIFVKINKQKLVLGTLNLHNIPQIALDLVFDRKFEISHNWKNGSVFFTGYKSPIPDDVDDLRDSDSEDVPLAAIQNGPKGKSEDPQPSIAKAATVKSKNETKKVKVVEPKKDGNDDEEEDDDEDEDDEDDSDDSASDEEMADGSDDDEDDDVHGEDEEKPSKPEPAKKRATDSAVKTPVPSKKAKVTTPQQKTDNKKAAGVHVDTPHPSKKALKTPSTADKSATPKSAGGEFFCKECNRGFKDKIAIASHNKAKHDAKA